LLDCELGHRTGQQRLNTTHRDLEQSGAGLIVRGPEVGVLGKPPSHGALTCTATRRGVSDRSFG
jgi:hypothetical protein